MENIKEVNIKNRTYYFFNDMINIKDFNWSLLKIDKNSYNKIGIYNIGYITIKKIDDYEDINSVNPLYLMIGKVIGHIEEKNGRKYLVFDLAGKNKEIFKKFSELWDGIKNKIETINDDECKYGKDFSKTKLDTDDNLSLNKPLSLHMLTIILRSVFEDVGKSYPQVYLDECLYELRV